MRRISMVLTILGAVLFSHSTHADDTTKRSEELQVLDRFVGTWDLHVTVKPAQGDATTEKTSEVRKWSLGGKFVHFENPREDQPDFPEFHMLVTYDPATKTYPGILMSGASRSLVDGNWNQQTKTMRFTGTFANGSKFDFKNQFLENGDIKSSGVITDASGKVVLERSDVQTRRKK